MDQSETAVVDEVAHRKVPASCKVCSAACGTVLTLDRDDRIVAIAPDRENPLSKGYACFKGLQTDLYSGPDRLLHPLKRLPDGSFQQISAEQALDEIAAKLRQLLESDGPDAIAGYFGTGSAANPLTHPVLESWLNALGSLLFSSMTVDQPAKWVTPLRLGAWEAGKHRLPDSDVFLIGGSNPVTSHLLYFGLFTNPLAELKAAKERGMKLIVIDPRRSETAHFADILLQPYPGEDATVVAGLIRIILEEGWEDKDFCARYTAGLDALRKGVDHFTPDYVEKRAGVPADQLYAAARMFSHEARRGAAYTGTGPNMAPNANLAEHLYECLNVICGRFYREGDAIINPGVLVPRMPMRAQVVPPSRPWETSKKSRVRHIGMINGQMMTAVLPEEILAPGPGNIKSLIVLAGNPANAFPETHKVVEALKALELLVVIDPNFSTTARYAHYILPPKLNYEYPTIPDYETVRFFRPYSQYSAGPAKPPANSEVLEEHYILWALAKRLGKQMHFAGMPLNMESAPSVDDMLDIMTRDSQVPLSEVKKYPNGHIFDVEPQFVQPGTNDARFEVFPADVAADLAEVATATFDETGRQLDHGTVFTHRLTCRRMRNVINSVTYLPATRKKHPFNAAFLHPDDLAALGVSSGEEIEITSAHGRITGIAMPDDKVRPGSVSMTHGFGGLPGDGSTPREGGSNVGLLIRLDQDMDKITAMPRLSAVPVTISKKA